MALLSVVISVVLGDESVVSVLTGGLINETVTASAGTKAIKVGKHGCL